MKVKDFRSKFSVFGIDMALVNDSTGEAFQYDYSMHEYDNWDLVSAMINQYQVTLRIKEN